MNETLENIERRYSCRDFKSCLPSKEDLNAIADSAIASPSGMNLQKWRIIVVTNRELLNDMEEEAMGILKGSEDNSAYERIKSRGGKVYYNAPCMIIVAIDTATEKDMTEVDCGIVCQNIALAATSLGLGNVICGMAGLPFSGGRGEEFKEKFKFEKGYEFGMSVLVGYANTGKEPHEHDKSKIIFIE